MISLELRQQLTAEISKLPDYQAQAMRNFDWIGELEKIAVKFNVTGDKERIFVTECAMAFLEISDPKQLVPEIVSRTGISESDVAKMMVDVIDRIAMRIQKEIQLVLGDTAPEIRAKLLQEFADQETLASTGLVLGNPTPATAISSADVRATMPTVSGVTKYSADPYHEPLE